MKPNKKEEGTVKQSVKALFALLFVLAISLSGCGNGTEDGGLGTPAFVPKNAVVSKGVIDSFGSIFVNGVEFDTAGAIVHLPDAGTDAKLGQNETEVKSHLKEGMVVTVVGKVDDTGKRGIATEIEFKNTLHAKIDSVDVVNNTITVMGQKIIVDDKIKSLLAGATPLKAGDVVEISGLPDDKGQIKATHLEKKDATEFEAKGFVKLIPGSSTSFTLLLSTNATTGVTVNLPAGATLPKDGAFMEVKTSTAAGGVIAVAEDKIKVETELHQDPAAVENLKLSIEGFPASGTVLDFILNGQQVKTSTSTVFVGGIAANFSTARKLQAQGTVIGGILMAEKITFKVVNGGLSKGVVEKFGSIFVNGVEFKTQGATLHLRDDKTTPDRVLQTETEIASLLKPGMVVTVKGGFDNNGTTGIAQEIEFRNAMEARIDDKGVDFITVMGQKVIVDDKIKAVLSTLAVGDDVAISGIPDDKGGLRATFVEKKTTKLTEFESKGIVSNATGNTFTLLTAKNATSGIAVTLGAGVALPANDSFVEVRTLNVGGVVTATKVELENELEAAENEKVEFEGFVASGAGGDFFIKGQHVLADATTVFVGGVKADLVPGMKVEAEGNIVGGILVATKVMFNDNVKIDAIVGGEVHAATATTQANLTLLGKKVIITSATALKGLGGTALDLATVSAGQELEIRGSIAANGTDIIAGRVTLKGTVADVTKFKTFLQGPVTLSASGAMSILGTTITTDASSQFRISTDQLVAQPSTSAVFFANVKSGVTVVKVKWDPLTGDIATQPVKEAEIQFGKL